MYLHVRRQKLDRLYIMKTRHKEQNPMQEKVSFPFSFPCCLQDIQIRWGRKIHMGKGRIAPSHSTDKKEYTFIPLGNEQS